MDTMKILGILILLLITAALIIVLPGIIGKWFRRKRLPLGFSLLTANVGNAAPARIMSHFKLQDSDTPVLRRNIGTLYPEIVFLQELAVEEQTALIINSEMYHTHYRDGNCTAVRKDFFESLRFVESLFENDGYTEYIATLRNSKLAMTLINVHTAAPLSDPSFGKRGMQIRSLIEELKVQASHGSKIIVAGDFNFDPDRFESFRHRIIKTDSVTELDKTKELWNEVLGQSDKYGLNLVSPDEPTWNLMKISYNIDHVIANITCTECEVLDDGEKRLDFAPDGSVENNSRNFMDHRAITAKFAI
jgi:hypothetical protein